MRCTLSTWRSGCSTWTFFAERTLVLEAKYVSVSKPQAERKRFRTVTGKRQVGRIELGCQNEEGIRDRESGIRDGQGRKHQDRGFRSGPRGMRPKPTLPCRSFE